MRGKGAHWDQSLMLYSQKSCKKHETCMSATFESLECGEFVPALTNPSLKGNKQLSFKQPGMEVITDG